MVKHNNDVPHAHFHKKWDTRVKTWFNQPAKKEARRNRREAKAARVFPRPVAGALRPVVQAPTRKYNSKTRFGRGFTHDEIRAVGLTPAAARAIGIAVDHRRRNRSEETLNANVLRLKEYQSKLILFPRVASKPKAGDASAEECSSATQHIGTVQPIVRAATSLEYGAITEEAKAVSAYKELKRAQRKNERYYRSQRRKLVMKK